MTKPSDTPRTRKVRRRSAGGKPSRGWEMQRAGRKVRRADVRKLHIGEPDARLTTVGGLVSFNAFAREQGLYRQLARRFGHLKTGRGVVYPMGAQMQLLLDMSVAGGQRVFDLEMLAADPLFVHLAGGSVPSIDVLYDDLRRFDPPALEDLEEVLAEQGSAPLRGRRLREVFVDLDTTVTPLFGTQEGALPGPNPRYHGRPSYHPILARVAQTGTIIGARLRPGDRGLGELDVEDVEQWLDRTRTAAGPAALITMRIDAGGDCAPLLRAIDGKGAWFLVKMKQTPNLVGAVWATKRWITVERDALGKPTRQVAEIDFEREDWPRGKWRVFAMRTNERLSGAQVGLWDDLDFSVPVYATNDTEHDADELARRYDERAGIEPVFAELKGGFGIGKVSTDCFDANEAAFLLKVLAFNLLRRWVQTRHQAFASWRTTWIRRVCVQVPGRLLRSGGRWELRLAPRPMLS
jgi:Transposase DDE domain group 1